MSVGGTNIGEEDFLKQALQIVDAAQAKNVSLRILGALAVYAHSKNSDECINAFKSLERLGQNKSLFTDLDLVGYRKQSKQIVQLLEGMRFKPVGMVNAVFGNKRLMYSDPDGKYCADIFLNKLEFSHDVNFGEEPGSGRLELSYPAITLADLVLEKLQIHQINRKDIIDLTVLFLGHEVTETLPADGDRIDGKYVATILSNDWGFWYDATINLDKVNAQAVQFAASGNLSALQVETVNSRISDLRAMIDKMPKSKSWEKRAKTGTKKSWYREVDEVSR
jgi:hypothetical protein